MKSVPTIQTALKSRNPKIHDGIPLDGIPFHPYYTVKDIVGVAVFLLFFATVIFYMPEMGGYFLEHANFIPADPMKTPEHIAPVWYFTPFYAILRAIPDKFAGVIGMGGSIVVLFLLPWLDRNPVKSIRYRGGIYKKALLLFVISFIASGLSGYSTCNTDSDNLCQNFYRIYFGFFLLMPIYTRWEKTKPVPKSLTEEHSLEEQLHTLEEQLPALLDEITELKPVAVEIGHPAFKSSFFSRRPNPEGILNVINRLARKLKESLD